MKTCHRHKLGEMCYLFSVCFKARTDGSRSSSFVLEAKLFRGLERSTCSHRESVCCYLMIDLFGSNITYTNLFDPVKLTDCQTVNET